MMILFVQEVTGGTTHFYDVTLGQIVTWLLVVIGVVVTRYVDLKILTQRVNDFHNWRTDHMSDARGRDQLIQRLDVTIQRLATLADLAEKRLDRLEDIWFARKRPKESHVQVP